MNVEQILSQARKLTSHKFTEHSLYPTPLEQSFAYSSISTPDLPLIAIICGTHGNEPAPMLAVEQIVDTLISHKKGLNFIFFPVINTKGAANKTRYPQDGTSCGDMSHLLPWYDPGKKGTHSHPPSGIPANEYAKNLGEFSTRFFFEHPASLVLDLHEDEVNENPNLPRGLTGGYYYSMFHPPQTHHQVIRKVFSDQNMSLIKNQQTRWGEKINSNGYIDFNKAGGSFPELISLTSAQKRSPSPAFTIETLTNQAIEHRINLHAAIVAGFCGLLSSPSRVMGTSNIRPYSRNSRNVI